MNKLFAYGCSWTHGYREEIDKGWVTRLKLNSEYKLINKGHSGAGWVTVRDKILTDIPTYSPNDVLIVQIPFSYRVEVPYFLRKYDSFMRFINEHPEGTIEWLKYILPAEELEKVTSLEVLRIFRILDYIGVKVIWWQAENMPTLMESEYPMLKLDGYNSYFDWSHTRYDLVVSGDETDTHLTPKGYDYQAEFFSKQLNEWLL